MEMLAVLALVLSKYEVRLEPDHPIDLEPLITLRPLHGIRTTIHPRK